MKNHTKDRVSGPLTVLNHAIHGTLHFLKIRRASPSVVRSSVSVTGSSLPDVPHLLCNGSASQPAHSRNARKLNILRKCGLFGENTHGARIERACSQEDLRGAYRLVHDIYIGTGYIMPQPAAMRVRIFEARPDTATFVAKVGKRVVGVLSIVADSPELGLPSDEAFKKELDAMRGANIRLCEATNQVVAEEYRKSAVSTELMRCAVAHMTNAGFDDVIATVSPSHNGFYELLNFREVGSERSYSTKIDDPVIALSMDVNQYRQPAVSDEEAWQFVHNFMADGNHFLGDTDEWEGEAHANFLDASLLRPLFVTQTGFVDRCTASEQKILKHVWGKKLYSEVCGQSLVASLQERMTSVLCWLDTMEFNWGVPTARSVAAH